MEISNARIASQSIESIYKLYNNPFLLAPLIIEFYSNYKSQPKDILLAYLIFPIVLHNESEKGLRRANSNRSLITYRRENNRICGLPERLSEYKELTQFCLQYEIDSEFVVVNKDLSICVINKPPINDSSLLPIQS